MSDEPAPDQPGFLIAGGGTAGHTNPGIAVAQALVDRGIPARQVRFVGGRRGNESTLVPAAGFEIDVLPGRGLSRRLAPRTMVQNLGAVLELLDAVRQAWRIVGRVRPQAVLCLGGYAAAPATLAAWLRRVPVVVTEQNARASAVNRWAARIARRVALPYPDTDLVGDVVGNPIRREVRDAVAGGRNEGAGGRDAVRRQQACEELGLDGDAAGRTVVAVWSGSLGARSVNVAARALAVAWADRDDVVLYHVVGRRDWSEFRDHPPEAAAGRLIYRTVEYEDRMPALLVAADLAVCRSGASTTAELAVAGLPAVLVPLPRAPRDHQRANAAELVGVGAAVLLDDDDLVANPAVLADAVAPIVADPPRRHAMAVAAASVARPAAADAVAEMMLRVGGRGADGGER